MHTHSIRQRIMRRDLVGYWPLAQGGAMDLRQGLIGPAGVVDAANVNSVTRGAGPGGNLADAASFNNSNHLTIAIAPRKGNWTATYWFRFASAAVTDSVIAMWENTGQRSFSFLLVSGVPTLQVSTLGSSTALSLTKSALSIDTFYFLAIRFDAARFRIEFSINGGAWTEGALGGQTFLTTNPLSLSAQSTGGVFGNFLTGLAGHLLVKDRLLTDAEVLWMYNYGRGRFLSPPKA